MDSQFNHQHPKCCCDTSQLREILYNFMFFKMGVIIFTTGSMQPPIMNIGVKMPLSLEFMLGNCLYIKDIKGDLLYVTKGLDDLGGFDGAEQLVIPISSIGYVVGFGGCNIYDNMIKIMKQPICRREDCVGSQIAEQLFEQFFCDQAYEILIKGGLTVGAIHFGKAYDSIPESDIPATILGFKYSVGIHHRPIRPITLTIPKSELKLMVSPYLILSTVLTEEFIIVQAIPTCAVVSIETELPPIV